MKADGARSGLLLNICREVDPHSTFLGGLGGSRKYLDLDAFAQAGVGVQWQQFQHPTYPQCGEAPFAPGLMALDLLFNCGPKGRELLWHPRVRRDELLPA
jgi:hypothetical protein